jgi:Asp-tRNA(Asn)/Glu-tRNA(Gln) amidotransferase C subunit
MSVVDVILKTLIFNSSKVVEISSEEISTISELISTISELISTISELNPTIADKNWEISRIVFRKRECKHKKQDGLLT